MNFADTFINGENMEIFGFTNISKIKGTPKGIVMSFHGKGFLGLFHHTPFTDRLAELDIVYISPYYGAWAWMNSAALALSDALVESIYKKYNITENLPMVSSGSSMGGINALLFSLFSRRPVCAAAMDSPVSEQVNHYNDGYYMAKTILPCFADVETEKNTAEFFADYCPVQLAEKMPHIPYFFVHGTADTDTPKAKHSDVLVKRLRETGHQVTYLEPEGMKHCVMPPEVSKQFEDFIVDSIIR